MLSIVASSVVESSRLSFALPASNEIPALTVEKPADSASTILKMLRCFVETETQNSTKARKT